MNKRWKNFFFSKKRSIVFFLLTVFFLLLIAVPYFQHAKVTIEIDGIERYNHIQVFWKNKTIDSSSSQYLNEKSVVKPLHPGSMKLIFSIPSLKIVQSLRVDPATIATTFVLRSITVTQPGFTPVTITTRKQIENTLKLHDVTILDFEEKGAVLRSLSTDPGLEFNVSSEFSYLRCIRDTLREYAEIISRRMDLLGLDWGGFFFLGLDLLFLASISITFVQSSGVQSKNSGELCLSLGLIGLSVILVTTIFCGVCYLLSWRNLLLSHILIWFMLHAVLAGGINKKIISTAIDNLLRCQRAVLQPIRAILWPADRRMISYVNVVLLASVLALLLYYFIPAAFTLPLNFDSNDYRLSRVGYWLQEGHVWQFPANDIRQIIMPSNCDLAMLWITSFFHKGYPLVHLISFAAGLLVCGAIYAFMSLLEFQQHWRLIAVIFWLGIPNSASEMLTSQTDLYTTGCLAAGLFFLYRALSGNKIFHYLLAGMGIGLAVGGKSTVFLWGPGLLFLFFCLLFFYRKRLNLPQFVKGMTVLLIILIITGGFVYAQNQVRYGNFLGPKLTVESIKDSDQAKVTGESRGKEKRPLSAMESFVFRAKMYAWQVFAPGSTLKILHPVSNFIFNTLENNIRENGQSVEASFLRRFDTATKWLKKIMMSEDYASFGLIPFTLFCLGGIVAFFRVVMRRDTQSVAAATLFIVTLLYMLFFCYIVGWTVHRYRYAVLVTPLIAFISVYLLSVLVSSVGSLRFVSIGIVCCITFYQFSMSVNVAHSSRTHGWPSFKSPYNAHNYIYYWYDMDQLVERLPENVKRVGLCLSKGSWKALFFRTGKDIKSYYVASKDTVIVNDKFFKENNFDGIVTKGLSSVVVEGEYNLIRSQRNTHQALVTIGSGEHIQPWLLKKGIHYDGWTDTKGRVIFGNWEDKVFGFTLCNPTDQKRDVVVKSSRQVIKHMFDINECFDINIEIKKNDIVKWKVHPGYQPSDGVDGKKQRTLGLKIILPQY